MRVTPRFVSRFLARERRNARKRWAQGLRGGRAWLTVPVAALSMYVLWHWAFGLGSHFGVSFAVAAGLAIVRGHVFTHPLRLVLVAAGVVIGTLIVPVLGEDAWQAFRRGDTLTALVLAGLIVLAWLLKRHLETGRKGIMGHGAPRRRRRPRRR